VLLFLTIYRWSACQSDELRFSVRFESSSQNQKPKKTRLLAGGVRSITYILRKRREPPLHPQNNGLKLRSRVPTKLEVSVYQPV
jgi:hypothetical protein